MLSTPGLISRALRESDDTISGGKRRIKKAGKIICKWWKGEKIHALLVCSAPFVRMLCSFDCTLHWTRKYPLHRCHHHLHLMFIKLTNFMLNFFPLFLLLLFYFLPIDCNVVNSTLCTWKHIFPADFFSSYFSIWVSNVQFWTTMSRRVLSWSVLCSNYEWYVEIINENIFRNMPNVQHVVLAFLDVAILPRDICEREAIFECAARQMHFDDV